MFSIKNGNVTVCGVPIKTTTVTSDDERQGFTFDIETIFHGTVEVSVEFGRGVWADNPGNHPNSPEAEVWCQALEADPRPYVKYHDFAEVIEEFRTTFP